jgi:hypothetical protein
MPKKLDFMTSTTLKVLEFFSADSRAEFHEREVIRNRKISKGSAAHPESGMANRISSD